MNCRNPWLFVLLSLGLLEGTHGHLPANDSRINKSAQALARQLAPKPPASKATPAGVVSEKARMIKIIEILENSSRTSGPQPESLLRTAFRFRSDTADFEKLMVTSTALNAWREAHARGLFDEQGRFRDRITLGRGEGNRCQFELIVPSAIYPEGSNQLANIRLIPIEHARKSEDAPLTNREMAHHRQLAKMMEEKENRKELLAFEKGAPEFDRPKTNSLGQDEKTSLALWKGEVEAAGDAADQMPVIRVIGKMSGTPSHQTKERWKTTTHLANLSGHPTEVEVDVYLIGVTDEKRDHYLMSKTTHTVKLRQNENISVDSFSRAENSYKGKADDHDEVPKKERKRTRVRCRGFVAIVRHGSKVAAFTGSDRMMERYGDPTERDSPLGSLPQF